jgi:hypothetical protein
MGQSDNFMQSKIGYGRILFARKLGILTWGEKDKKRERTTSIMPLIPLRREQKVLPKGFTRHYRLTAKVILPEEK